MVTAMSNVPWRRVLAAAARIALIYAIGVLLLFGALTTITGDLGDVLRNVRRVAGPASILFAILFATAFVLLAVARRAGFAALWVLLGGLWAWLIFESGLRTWMADGPFVMWTLLAMPLYAIGAIGTSSPTRSAATRWRPSGDLLMLGGWVALLFPALSSVSGDLRHGPHFDVSEGLLAAAIGYAWLVAPLLIAVFALTRVWRATGRLLEDRAAS